MKPSKRNKANAAAKAAKYGGKCPALSNYARKTGKGLPDDPGQTGKAAGVQVTGKA